MSRFSDFFHHASDKEKEAVFLEAGRKASEDQRRLLATPKQTHE